MAFTKKITGLQNGRLYGVRVYPINPNGYAQSEYEGQVGSVEMGGMALSKLSVGDKVLHNGVHYSIIAKGYCAADDVILWEDTASGNGGGIPANAVKDESPFGDVYTNKVTMRYADLVLDDYTNEYKAATKEAIGRAWIPPARALGYATTYGSPYISTMTQMGRTKATAYNLVDRLPNDGDWNNLYVSASGRITTENTNPLVSRDLYYAYSVKGTALVEIVANADGSHNMIL